MIEKLGESGIKILMYLAHRKAKLSDFKEELGMGTDSIYRALKILIDNGLVIELDAKGYVRLFELTERGRRVVECLNKAEEILTKGT